MGSVRQCTLNVTECDFRWEIELALSDLGLEMWPLCFIKSAPKGELLCGFIYELHKVARLGQKAQWSCQAEEERTGNSCLMGTESEWEEKVLMLVAPEGQT